MNPVKKGRIKTRQHAADLNRFGDDCMNKRLLPLILSVNIILTFIIFISPGRVLSAEPEYAWVLVDIIDYENAEKWASADAHESYAVTHSYSRGSYSASTTFEGNDIYGTGLGGTLSVKADFSGVPDIIYPDKPVPLEFSFVPVEDSVKKLSLTAFAAADFDQWDVAPGGKTRANIPFENNDGESGFSIIGESSVSFNETLLASLGTGTKNSRVALRLYFYFGAAMGTNYVYEWKQTNASPVNPTETVQTPQPTYTSWVSPLLTQDPSKEPSTCKIGGLHGEVNVKPNDEDDDAYIFAESGMLLYHNDRVRTLSRSGCILSFSDMSTYIMKENTAIVLDLATEKESKIALVAGNVWINLKKMIKGGSMEVEMSQAIAGAKGTTFVCEETNGRSVLKVFEGTVEFTSVTNGESVLVKGGQMAVADKNGIGEISSFDMDTELLTWDENTRILTADAISGNRTGSMTSIILIVLTGIVLTVLILFLIKRRRMTAPALSSAQNDTFKGPSGRFCSNCGNLVSQNNKFCAKCGRHL